MDKKSIIYWVRRMLDNMAMCQCQKCKDMFTVRLSEARKLCDNCKNKERNSR